jgi:hypothetical protein
MGMDKMNQGDAGFLTQEQIDEMAAGTTDASEKSPEVPEPAAETVDTTFVDFSAAEEAPSAPLTPEHHAQVLEQIGEEEIRLDTNLTEHGEVVSAAETRLNDSASEASESKKLLTYAQIGELYKKTSGRVANMFYGGLLGTSALMAAGTAGVVHGGPESFMSPGAAEKAQHILDMGRHAMEGGAVVLVGTLAIAGIAQTMNWLKKRSREKAYFKPQTA